MLLIDALRAVVDCDANGQSMLYLSWEARARLVEASDVQLARIGAAPHKYGADIADAARSVLWARAE